MAITAVTLISGRNMRVQRDGRSAQQEYRVVSDDPNEPVENVRFAADPTTGLEVPRRGDWFEGTDIAMACTTLDIQQGDIDHRLEWRVVAGFETGVLATEQENPLDAPPEVVWDDMDSTEPVYVDRQGDPITNSAGETFDPPVSRLFFDSQVTVTRNVPFHDQAFALSYKGKANAGSFNVDGHLVNPEKALVVGWSGQNGLIQNGFTYARETIRIALRGDGWKRNLLDQGYTERDGANRQQVIKDDSGAPMNQPVKLDGAGHRLEEGAAAVFLVKEVYDVIDYSGINLPA